jgi:hypothetical protein
MSNPVINTAPVSLAAAPPQPNQAYYGTEALTLFKSFTRDSYQAAFGVSAPAYDPSRVIKTWFDSAADTSNPSNVSVYNILTQDSSANWVVQQMVMPASEAASVNFPGAVTYPPYVPAPTNATRGGSGINGLYLSFLTDAQSLMMEIGGTSIVDEGNSPVFPVIFPPDELRRVWDIMFKGNPLNVGLLIADKFSKGVGAPGQWNTAGPDAVWVPALPAPTGLDDIRPPRPIPVRALLPNEVLKAGLMGVGIVRTDLQTTVDQANGEFTADDRATLQQIYHLLSKFSLT